MQHKNIPHPFYAFVSLFFVMSQSACSSADFDNCTDCSENVESTNPFLGRWEMDVATVAFFEDDEMFTIPVSIYPNEVVDVYYTDSTRGSFQAALNLNLDFISENTVEVQNRTFIEEELVSNTFDSSIVSWRYDDSYIYLTTTDFNVTATYEFASSESEEALFLEWDRDAPDFQDDSCIIHISLTKTQDR